MIKYMPNQPAGSDAARQATQRRQDEQQRVQAAQQRNRQQSQRDITSSGGIQLPKLGMNGDVTVSEGDIATAVEEGEHETAAD